MSRPIIPTKSLAERLQFLRRWCLITPTKFSADRFALVFVMATWLGCTLAALWLVANLCFRSPVCR